MNRIYQTLKLHINNVNESTFEQVALAVFRYQVQNNRLYQQFINLLGISIQDVKNLQQIPFLPIQFFKYHTIKSQDWSSEVIFTSSGTTLKHPSKHHVRSLDWYKHCAFQTFEAAYGSLQNYAVVALLPSYLERTGSSLVFMAEQFIQRSQHPLSGFFLYNTDELIKVLGHCQKENQPVLLLGVTYALLDLAKKYPQALRQVILMETGGMKGKRAEMTKAAVHQELKTAFQLETIHSEYGMTELLSQAYSKGNGIFQPSRLMRVLIRETTDPLNILPSQKTGGINIIDLANIDTCSFIATDDLGRSFEDGSFSVLGRFDASDLRGCNLLVNEV
ncbi:acyl transferase [Aureispira anguillae]|uniref:Acyl transferase n=1 Tax=Aureispira anguillae TaxID=2864201 RepID=A0A915YFP4_9BACT|nr:acyl transferase [Aureispira anguillae]BDS12263.1 acyl transferase [Aureispira anguillae]